MLQNRWRLTLNKLLLINCCLIGYIISYIKKGSFIIEYLAVIIHPLKTIIMTFDEKKGMYYPTDDIIDQANVKEYEKLYKYSVENPEFFWAEQAEKLVWFKKWDKVLDDSDKPFYKWFQGGKINIVHNAIDRHLTTANRNKLAIIWEGENGDVRTFSYHAI